MIRKAVLSVCLVALAAGCATRAWSQEKFIVDKVVANVGTSVILYSEIEEVAKQLQQERRERGYTSDRNPKSEGLEYLLMQKLLYNQAQIDSVMINTEYIAEMVEENVTYLVQQEGSVSALEALYHKPIFEIKSQLRTRYEEMSYAREMRSEIQDKVTVTPGEVERYFKSLPKDSLPIIPEQYIYAHIVKYPSSTKEAKQRVRERLLEMRERVINGTRFDMLARMYSADQYSAVRGGEMDPAPKESFVAPFANALEKLKPGQISEVIETEYGFHIIELIDQNGSLYHARHILLRPEFTYDELAESDRFLDSLAGLIRSGDLKFEDAAMQHSEDPHSRRNGGVVSNYDLLDLYNMFDASLTTTKFYKEDLTPDVFRELSSLQPGEISRSFQSMDLKSNVLSKIVKLVEIIPSHPANLKDDYLRVEEMTLADKQRREFDRWLLEKIDGMYIRIDPDYRYDDFENPAWLK